jgi:Peptidase family M50
VTEFSNPTGIEIEGITLWLFGGVARFKGTFPSGGAESLVAIAGPLVSLVLGVLFVLVALADVPEAVDGVVSWLGYINLSLLVFNLLPAVPLDGGRVLHSVLWRIKSDLAWATRIAADVGLGFAYLFIAAGLAMFIFQSSFSGAWLAFIGRFLLQAAGAEARYVLAGQALEGLRVRDLMTTDRSRSPRPDRGRVHGRGRPAAPAFDLPRRRQRRCGRTVAVPAPRFRAATGTSATSATPCSAATRWRSSPRTRRRSMRLPSSASRTSSAGSWSPTAASSGSCRSATSGER